MSELIKFLSGILVGLIIMGFIWYITSIFEKTSPYNKGYKKGFLEGRIIQGEIDGEKMIQKEEKEHE